MNAIIISALWGIILMLCAVFIKNKKLPGYFAIAGVLILILSNQYEFFAGPFFNINTRDFFRVDSLGLLINTVALVCTLILFLLNGNEIESIGSHVAEYFSLIFFVLCGVSVCSSYNTLWMLFLGLELISVPLYILVGSDKTNLKGNEASLKFFLIGMFMTAVLLLGIAFIYGGNSLGSFSINFFDMGKGHMPILIASGLILLFIAMSFRASAVPFHFWAPDVYDGAPAPIGSLMATIVKAGVFIAFLRLFENSFAAAHHEWQPLVVIVIAATLFIGNIAAVFQQSVKRMLAYSAIAQSGFMMFAIFAINAPAEEGLLLYLTVYSLATIGMFAIVSKMPDYTLDGFRGLGKAHPWLGFSATVFLLSLTGIPLTGGFTAKFYMLWAAVRDGYHFWLVVFALLCVAISSFYYFRVIQAIYFKKPESDPAEPIQISRGFKWTLSFIMFIIILLGIAPNLLIDWIYY